MTAAISSFGAYIPQLRLQRRAIADAYAWYDPGLASFAKGERAMASWDEDVVTMAVEAARDCLGASSRADIARVVLASTTSPFADRQNAAIVKEALNLSDQVATADVGGGQRAGVSALLLALETAEGRPTLCVTSEKRRARPASPAEMAFGDAAAAFVVGAGPGVAELLASYSVSVDLVDHFRGAGQAYDYSWESRWVREEGYGRIAPAAVKAALAKAGLGADAVSCLIVQSPSHAASGMIARACGIPEQAICDPLHDRVGDAGCVQPVLLLAHVLERVAVGDILVLLGFGQGCDVLVLRATGLPSPGSRVGVSGWLNRRRPEGSYLKYLSFSGELKLERGMRSESDQKTSLSALYRHRKEVMGLVGGRAVSSGAVQFPKAASSADVGGWFEFQEDWPLADRGARVLSHTADRLAYSPDPPVRYGAIEFEGGGRMTAEFTDAEDGDIAVGVPVEMMFRIKAIDELRGFSRYFWKAAPAFRRIALEKGDA